MSAGLTEIWTGVTNAVYSATVDPLLIIAFAAIGYLGGMANMSLTQNVPSYYGKLAVSQGIAAITDMTKLSLWTSAIINAKPAAPSH